MRPRPSALLAVSLLAAGLAAVAHPAAGVPTSGSTGLPYLSPAPQEAAAKGGPLALGARVSLATGPGTDASAVTAVRTALTAHGVTVAAGAATRIQIGGPRENPTTALALADLHAPRPDTLPAEGYVLASGTARGRTLVVLAGRDTTGTFYAAQTFRQLLTGTGTRAKIAGAVVRDWPDESLRGTIEGFYGTPWSDAARLDQMDFYGAHKMNTYVYSPKDDPYLRAKWRDAYPADQLATLRTLVARATANHVEFTYALSPGLSVCYTSAADEQALVDKFQSLWDIGVRSFSIPLDDISYTKWNCDADETKFGTGGGAAGQAQSYLLNQVQKDFIATHDGAQRLQMVPTEYYDVNKTPYKDAITKDLDDAVLVGWTGVGVIAPTITGAQAKAAETVFGHDILLWDNYPVNDYVTDRLLLGPYVGRDADVTDHLAGVTANPMIQPDASKIALAGVAGYTWNSADYDAEADHAAVLTELTHGDKAARAALAAFADLENFSRLDETQAPELAARIARFRSDSARGVAGAPKRLDAYLAVIETAQATLTDRMGDPAFVTETTPWLGATTAWGRAARAALRILQALRAGEVATALDERATAVQQRDKAKAFVYEGLGGTVHVSVGDGVLDTFVADALAALDTRVGIGGRHVTATTSLPTYQTYAPANMVDGDPATWFWSDGAPGKDDTLGVDLGTAQPITGVHVRGGDDASPDDYLHHAVLEYSSDGTSWTTIGTYTDQASIDADVPAGTSARYVRLRATAGQDYWVKLHEFTVDRPEAEALTASGAPAPSAGSSFDDAVDADLDTAYVAGSDPQSGDAVTVTLPSARRVGTVRVVGSGTADVEVQQGGTWRRIGSLRSDGWTELSVTGPAVSAVRLAWQAGSPRPRIAEIVPV